MKKFLGLITRCKDEFFIKEFVEYYLREGVDHIYIVDDDSNDKDIYNDILFYRNVTIAFEKNTRDEAYEANRLYRRVRGMYEWLAFIDVDEFIAPKKNPFKTIRDELADSFSQYDCVKIPWVMMSSAGRDKNPSSVLRDNIWRWNHDNRHPHPLRKFKCRYDRVEVKCIFRPDKFKAMDLHFPTDTLCEVSVIDSVYKEQATLSHFYDNFREHDIKTAYLVCYHHRMISRENSLNKIKCSKWYHDFKIEEVLSGDYAEILDNTLSVRQFRKKIFIIGFDHLGASILHRFFKSNGLASVWWDDGNLVKTMLLNRESGHKLLSSGEVCNTKINSNTPYNTMQVISGITWDEKNLNAKDFYKDLDRQYPNSKFIINISNLNRRTESRKQLKNATIDHTLKKSHDVDEANFESSIHDKWVRALQDMKAHFCDRNDLLVFDIDKHTKEDLQEFFKNDMLFNPGIDLN